MSIDHPNFGKLPDDRVIIFDTTLRDGEQSPGFSMNLQEKLRMAEALTELGVDHSPVDDVPGYSVVVFRDPDNVQLEFIAMG